ncbi:MAG: ribosome maturation factor RimM [Synergistaceae bacterium]|jgi:16S rRNA processing protein RimM|nr:ribosome maturation factor RimM [Synergistaceae bacterium]
MSISSSGGQEPDRIQIGRIVGAHGVRGEIRIMPTTDYPERFFGMKTLRAEFSGGVGASSKPAILLKVTGIRPHEGKGQILVTADGIDDKNSADELKGRVITVAPDERVELPEGEYWIDSLIGLNVIDDDRHEHLGKIEDVMSTGSNDIYQIRTGNGAMKLIPAVGDVIRSISLDEGVIRIHVLEGLWD